MSINKLCTKFKISDELWKSVINNIRHHHLFDELFPKSEENSGFVTKVLQDHDLCKRDDSGLIYSTVCLLFNLLVPEPFFICSRTLLFMFSNTFISGSSPNYCLALIHPRRFWSKTRSYLREHQVSCTRQKCGYNKATTRRPSTSAGQQQVHLLERWQWEVREAVHEPIHTEIARISPFRQETKVCEDFKIRRIY